MLGTPFHDVTMDETLEWIAHIIVRKTPSFLVTANLDFATQAAEDVELQRILVEAELVLCDGTPLVWTSRLTGHPLRERVAGSDLVPRIAERGAREGWRIFLLGGDPSSLEAAARNLATTHPGLLIAGTYSPPFAPLHEFDHAGIAARIREVKPDILLVAFGCPKQEKWIYAHYRELGVPCAIGVGATIDFLAGKVHRAPGWLGKIGCEWIFRMLQEPRRLVGRYAKDFLFLFQQILRERKAILQTAKPNERAESSQIPLSGSDCELLSWKGPIVAGTLASLAPPSLGKPYIVDLSETTRIDSGGLGFLLRTLRKGWAQGIPGCFCGVPPAIRSVLEMTRLDRVVPTAGDTQSAMAVLAREKANAYLRPIVDPTEGSMLFLMPQRITSSNAADCIAAAAKEWQARPNLHTLRIDLATTSFIDSSGLGFLIRCHRLVAERNAGHLEILHPCPNVRNVIKIAKLEKLFGMDNY